jgi:hypothetical protein
MVTTSLLQVNCREHIQIYLFVLFSHWFMIKYPQILKRDRVGITKKMKYKDKSTLTNIIEIDNAIVT